MSNVEVPSYFHVGSRLGQILHARLRMKCSSLKEHLFLKKYRALSIMLMWRG